MSCVIGIPGPVHNPSCSSPQVLSSQFEALIFSSCLFEKFLSSLAITLYLAEDCMRMPHITVYDNSECTHAL